MVVPKCGQHANSTFRARFIVMFATEEQPFSASRSAVFRRSNVLLLELGEARGLEASFFEFVTVDAL